MKQALLCLCIAVAGGGPGALAAEVEYHPGTTHKVLQVTGEWDKARHAPTLSRSESRAGVVGTDLGSSFEHDGRLCFLFGDTQGRPGNTMDCLAYSQSTDPEQLVLHFPVAADHKFRVLKVPGIAQGGMEVPSYGISLGQTMYVVFTTDWHQPSGNMERSVLARSDDDGRTWTRLYTLSAAVHHDMRTAKFINVSMVVSDIPTAEEAAPFEPGRFVFVWGTGAYRKSNPYLARVPAARIGEKQAFRYFAGDDADGPARGGAREEEAAPLFAQPQLGEFSVAWIEPVHRWVMLYNAGQPRGITLRTAPRPRGPWSAGQVVFDPWKDHGYGHFMHVPAEAQREGHDGLSDPGREQEWGGEYGPYLIGRFTRGDAQHCHIFYTMSTWNPYQTVLMESEIGIGRNP